MKQDILMLWQRLPHKALLLVVVVLTLFQYAWFAKASGHFTSLISLPLYLITMVLSLILLVSWLIVASRYALKLSPIFTVLGIGAVLGAYFYIWHKGYSLYPNVILLTLLLMAFGLVLSAHISRQRRVASWLSVVFIILFVPLAHSGMREVLKLFTSGVMTLSLPANRHHSATRLLIPAELLDGKLETDSKRRHYSLDLSLQQHGLMGKLLLATDASVINTGYYPDNWLLELAQYPALQHYHQLAYYAGDQLPQMSEKNKASSGVIHSLRPQTDLFFPSSRKYQQDTMVEGEGSIDFIFVCDRKKIKKINHPNKIADLKDLYVYCVRYPLVNTKKLFAYSYRLKAEHLNRWQSLEDTIQQKLSAMRTTRP